MDRGITFITGEAELQDLYRLRYRLRGEAEASANEVVDEAAGTVTDPLDASADNLVAYQGGEIVAAVRINLLPAGSAAVSHSASQGLGLRGAYPVRTSITSRLIVCPRVCRTMLPMRLCVAAYEHLLDRGVQVNFIDVDESRAWFFRRQGYKAETPALMGGAETQRMRLDILDEAHLTAVKSPLLRSLKGRQSVTRLRAA